MVCYLKILVYVFFSLLRVLKLMQLWVFEGEKSWDSGERMQGLKPGNSVPVGRTETQVQN